MAGEDAAAAVARAIRDRGLTVVAAESVTAGAIATALAAADEASTWFRGSVVAYHIATKRGLLGVASEQLITAECAREMAAGVLRITGADIAVAVTGVGGPEPEEGRAPGTVYICSGRADDLRVTEHHFAGDPPEVVRQATAEALRQLIR